MITNEQQPSSRTTARASTPVTQPAYRVQKNEEGLTILLAVPGVSRDKLVVSTEQATLTITGQRHPNIPPEWKCHRSPSHPASYRLVLRLPADLDPSTTHAHLNEGLLTLKVRHHESARPRRIEVN